MVLIVFEPICIQFITKVIDTYRKTAFISLVRSKFRVGKAKKNFGSCFVSVRLGKSCNESGERDCKENQKNPPIQCVTHG